MSLTLNLDLKLSHSLNVDVTAKTAKTDFSYTYTSVYKVNFLHHYRYFWYHSKSQMMLFDIKCFIVLSTVLFTELYLRKLGICLNLFSWISEKLVSKIFLG